MPSFEFIYEQPCQMPLRWDRLEDKVLVETEAIQEMEEQMKMIIQRIKEAKDRAKELRLMRIDVDRSYEVGN